MKAITDSDNEMEISNSFLIAMTFYNCRSEDLSAEIRKVLYDIFKEKGTN